MRLLYSITDRQGLGYLRRHDPTAFTLVQRGTRSTLRQWYRKVRATLCDVIGRRALLLTGTALTAVVVTGLADLHRPILDRLGVDPVPLPDDADVTLLAAVVTDHQWLSEATATRSELDDVTEMLRRQLTELADPAARPTPPPPIRGEWDGESIVRLLTQGAENRSKDAMAARSGGLATIFAGLSAALSQAAYVAEQRL